VFTAIIISSVSSSIFFFIVGIICGQITGLIKKKTKSKQPRLSRDSIGNSPVYEVVPPIDSPTTAKNYSNQQAPKEVNVQMNEAYSTPIKILT
jgi:hypothetical protein